VAYDQRLAARIHDVLVGEPERINGRALRSWIDRVRAFVASLPPKSRRGGTPL
jgi:hypothetical protein